MPKRPNRLQATTAEIAMSLGACFDAVQAREPFDDSSSRLDFVLACATEVENAIAAMTDEKYANLDWIDLCEIVADMLADHFTHRSFANRAIGPREIVQAAVFFAVDRVGGLRAARRWEIGFSVTVDAGWRIDQADDDGNPVVLGRGDLVLWGCNMHVRAIRVSIVDGKQVPADEVAETYERLAELDEASEPFYVTSIPGFDGEWVVFVTPYAD